jgi:hypothetical protein
MASMGELLTIGNGFVEIVLDLKNSFPFWNHQVYRDQNTMAVRPPWFFASILIRFVPFTPLASGIQLIAFSDLQE